MSKHQQQLGNTALIKNYAPKLKMDIFSILITEPVLLEPTVP
jgi:hypothetical protein